MFLVREQSRNVLIVQEPRADHREKSRENPVKTWLFNRMANKINGLILLIASNDLAITYLSPLTRDVCKAYCYDE